MFSISFTLVFICGLILSDCSLSVHRRCVHVVDENCPGPLIRKERANDRISRIMERIRPERKPPSSHHHHSQNHMHLSKSSLLFIKSQSKLELITFVFLVERIKRGEEDAAGLIMDSENGKFISVFMVIV